MRIISTSKYHPIGDDDTKNTKSIPYESDTEIYTNPPLNRRVWVYSETRDEKVRANDNPTPITVTTDRVLITSPIGSLFARQMEITRAYARTRAPIPCTSRRTDARTLMHALASF